MVQHVEQHLRQRSKRTISCSLHGIQDKKELWQRISLALQVQIRAQDPVQEIISILNAQETILILYDVDGYADEIVQAIRYLQEKSLALTIIYTAVRALNIAQEYTIVLSPLSRFASVLFFVHKAQQIIPKFVITPSNKMHVFDICARLGGLPLALEIATSHLRSLSLDDLHKRITQNTLHTHTLIITLRP